MIKIYKIDAEWDLGVSLYYTTKEKAMATLRNINWERDFEDTLENLMKDYLVIIQEITVV